MARGDHLEVNRGGFYHHGIDLGNGEVVHFTGDPFNKFNAEVSREPIADFARRGSPRIVSYSKNVLHPDHACINAMGQWLTKKKGYRLITNNCEHLAAYCKTGVARSKQVEDYFNTLGQRIRLVLLRPSGEAFAAAVTGDIIIRAGQFITRTISEYFRPGRPGSTSILPPLYRAGRWWRAPNGVTWIEGVTPGWWFCWDSSTNNFLRRPPPQDPCRFLFQQWEAYPDRLKPDVVFSFFNDGSQWYIAIQGGLQPLSPEKVTGLDNATSVICSMYP